jgi:putative membrane protein (TIGR04086 family)
MKLKSIQNTTVKAVTKGILHAVVLSLALVLLFAFVVLVTGLPSGAIKPVAQVIKILSIFWGTLIALRGIEKRGWMFGALVGLLYTVIIFLIFSIISTDFGIVSGIWVDGLFACAIGAISAMILKTLRARTI